MDRAEQIESAVPSSYPPKNIFARLLTDRRACGQRKSSWQQEPTKMVHELAPVSLGGILTVSGACGGAGFWEPLGFWERESEIFTFFPTTPMTPSKASSDIPCETFTLNRFQRYSSMRIQAPL